MLPDRKLNRLKLFDYRNEATYFVTICTDEREMVFGEIINGEMHSNEFGKIADEQFKWLANQYPYIFLHAWIVMPNHVHVLLEIERNLEGHKTLSLSQLIGAYKTLSSRTIRLAGSPDFAWQRSFHDHIIRDQKGFGNILEYIQNNPANWEKDVFRRDRA